VIQCSLAPTSFPPSSLQSSIFYFGEEFLPFLTQSRQLWRSFLVSFFLIADLFWPSCLPVLFLSRREAVPTIPFFTFSRRFLHSALLLVHPIDYLSTSHRATFLFFRCRAGVSPNLLVLEFFFLCFQRAFFQLFKSHFNSLTRTPPFRLNSLWLGGSPFIRWNVFQSFFFQQHICGTYDPLFPASLCV